MSRPGSLYKCQPTLNFTASSLGICAGFVVAQADKFQSLFHHGQKAALQPIKSHPTHTQPPKAPTHLPRQPQPQILEIRNPPIKAPIALTPPPQRLVLGSPDLARFWVNLALELGRRAFAEGEVRRLA